MMKTTKTNTKPNLQAQDITPMIDKLSLTIKMPDTSLHGLMIHSLIDNKDTDPHYAEGTDIQNFPIAAVMYGRNDKGKPDKSRKILIQSTNKAATIPRVRLEFNPIKLLTSVENGQRVFCDDQHSFLDVYFTELVGMGFFDFISHARVTRYDVCIDIKASKPENYLIESAYTKQKNMIFGKDGELETIYLGKSTSNQTVIYNKTKQMKDYSSSEPLLRIERRMKPKDTNIHELAMATNPFKKLLLWDLSVGKSPIPDYYWHAVKNLLSMKGVKQGLNELSPAHRDKVHDYLQQNKSPICNMSDDEWQQGWIKNLQLCGFDCLNQTPPPLSLKYLQTF